MARNPRSTRLRIAAAIVAVAVSAAQAPVTHANPEVKEHEIARFLMLKTSCVAHHPKRTNPGERPPRFHADCKNVSNWPDGIVIECPEHDDDRSCRVVTAEKLFKHLDILRRPDTE